MDPRDGSASENFGKSILRRCEAPARAQPRHLVARYCPLQQVSLVSSIITFHDVRTLDICFSFQRWRKLRGHHYDKGNSQLERKGRIIKWQDIKDKKPWCLGLFNISYLRWIGTLLPSTNPTAASTSNSFPLTSRSILILISQLKTSPYFMKWCTKCFLYFRSAGWSLAHGLMMGSWYDLQCN